MLALVKKRSASSSALWEEEDATTVADEAKLKKSKQNSAESAETEWNGAGSAWGAVTAWGDEWSGLDASSSAAWDEGGGWSEEHWEEGWEETCAEPGTGEKPKSKKKTKAETKPAQLEVKSSGKGNMTKSQVAGKASGKGKGKGKGKVTGKNPLDPNKTFSGVVSTKFTSGKLGIDCQIVETLFGKAPVILPADNTMGARKGSTICFKIRPNTMPPQATAIVAQ
eukprot:TRINITY_DN270_c1_g1_i1.p1 TRINITY_DN270_c1_g1~~TRINITY_DN270_c1_g1_i1.p1  ORF type:complete len:251 (+),score=65.46 TRINITY_DN270_c1_g1_i1:82-753(+)